MMLKASSDQTEQGKLRFSSKIKKELKMERYLSVIQNSEISNYVARFRFSADKFPKETGRYVNIDPQSRVCTLCERGIAVMFLCK